MKKPDLSSVPVTNTYASNQIDRKACAREWTHRESWAEIHSRFFLVQRAVYRVLLTVSRKTGKSSANHVDFRMRIDSGPLLSPLDFPP